MKTEQVLNVVIPLYLIFEFFRRLFFPGGGERPSPTVNLLTIAIELGMVVGVIGLIFQRLQSTSRPVDAMGPWLILPILGLLAGLGLFVIRLAGGTGG